MIEWRIAVQVLTAWIVPSFQGLLNQSNLEKDDALEHDYFLYRKFIPYVYDLYSHI
jgi:hypothetical protein